MFRSKYFNIFASLSQSVFLFFMVKNRQRGYYKLFTTSIVFSTV